MSRKNTRKNKGLGDHVEAFTKSTGIKSVVEFFNDGKPCGACEKRKEKLNSLSLFKQTKVQRTFTKEEYEWYKLFKENRTLNIDYNSILKLCQMYSDVFKLPYWKPTCFACQGTITSISNMIDKLDKIYNTYENN